MGDVSTQKLVEDSLNLYHLTALQCKSIYTTCSGSFSTPKVQELVLGHPNGLSLCSLDAAGKLKIISQDRYFCSIRAICTVPFSAELANVRATGAGGGGGGSNEVNPVDLLAVTTESGKLILLRYANDSSIDVHADISQLYQRKRKQKRGGASSEDSESSSGSESNEAGNHNDEDDDVSLLQQSILLGRWKIVASITFGKSGIRRNVPGEYLVVDPKSRCVMVAAMEKQKFVIPLKWSKNVIGKVSFGSPLEAHKSALVHACVAVDAEISSGAGLLTGLGQNPVFACLEHPLEPGEAMTDQEKHLVYYELDLSLNHVVRSWSMMVNSSAHHLVALPGGRGPSGVIVCSESEIHWAHNTGHHVSLRQVVPRRDDLPMEYTEGLIFTCSSLIRVKDDFFLLLQNEVGDLYRVTMTWKKSVSLSIRYYDTVPVAHSLVILRKGYLFIASENSAHQLYKIIGDGFPDDAYITRMWQIEAKLSTGEIATKVQPIFSRHSLTFLAVVDELVHPAPMLQCAAVRIGDYDSKSTSVTGPQKIITLYGKGRTSAIGCIRHGIPFTRDVSITLPLPFDKIWSIPLTNSANYDGRIIVSNKQVTMVLAFDGSKLEEDTTSGFVLSNATLGVATLPNNAGFVQVHTEGIRHVRHDHSEDWTHAIRKRIAYAAINDRQVVVSFQNGGVSYFEVDSITGRPTEQGKEFLLEVAVCSLAIHPKPMSPFVGVGFLNREFQILSLERSSSSALAGGGGSGLFRSLNSGALVCDSDIESTGLSFLSDGQLYAFVGLKDGTLVQTTVDAVSGKMTTCQAYNIGSRPCQLLVGDGQTYIYALSQKLVRCHISDENSSSFTVTPMIEESALRHQQQSSSAGMFGTSCSFYSTMRLPTGQIGLLGISKKELYLFSTGRSTDRYRFDSASLMNTAKRMVVHPTVPVAVVLESENRCLSHQELMEKSVANPQVTPGPGGPNHYTSCLQLVDLQRPVPVTQGEFVPIPPGETALAITLATFPEFGRDPCIVVATARNFSQNPLRHDGGAILLFRFTLHGLLSNQTQTLQQQSPSLPFEFIHATPIPNDIALSLHSFQGMLLVGMADADNGLFLYAWGRSQLLRKYKLAFFPSSIVSIQSMGDHIVVGDMRESVFFVKYYQKGRGAGSRSSLGGAGGGLGAGFQGELHIFADDILRRKIVCMCMLDPLTVCVSDRFGNVNVLRLPPDVSDEATAVDTEVEIEASSGSDATKLRPKVIEVCAMNVGEIVVSLERLALPNIGGGGGGKGGTDGTSSDSQSRGVILYATITGKIGFFMTFDSEAEYAPLYFLQTCLRNELTGQGGNHPTCNGYALGSSDHFQYRSPHFPMKNVIDGDFVELFSKLDSAMQGRVEKMVSNEILRITRLQERQQQQNAGAGGGSGKTPVFAPFQEVISFLRQQALLLF